MFGRMTLLGFVLVLAAASASYFFESRNSDTAQAEQAPIVDQAPEAEATPEEQPAPKPAPEEPPPAPEPPPPPPPPANRADCNAIRGTNYQSAAERTWYLANCR